VVAWEGFESEGLSFIYLADCPGKSIFCIISSYFDVGPCCVSFLGAKRCSASLFQYALRQSAYFLRYSEYHLSD